MKEYWQEFVEQLMRSGAVRALEQDLLAACGAKGEMAFLTIDCTYKPCLSLLGQAPRGSSAATHAAQPRTVGARGEGGGHDDAPATGEEGRSSRTCFFARGSRPCDVLLRKARF